jgi:Uma2 family endonuclease
MKVRVIAGNCFFYPDLVGSCDSTDDDERYVEHPCFVIEVLSPSTASMDRTEKRDAYLTLESLDEYVIVEQSQMRISVYRRLCRPWVAEVLDAPNDVLKLTCIRVGMALADIYEGVRFSQDVMRNYPVVRAPAITASEVQP